MEELKLCAELHKDKTDSIISSTGGTQRTPLKGKNMSCLISESFNLSLYMFVATITHIHSKIVEQSNPKLFQTNTVTS